MPEVGSLNQRATIDTSSDIVSETLIFSPEVLRADNFNPEDHVIFVVPESSDLVTTESADVEQTRFVIPASEGDVSGSSFTASELRETIKSNFLVITKLLPSKSPPPLIPFATKETSEAKEVADEGAVLQRLNNLPKPLLPKPAPTKTPRQPKTCKPHSGKPNSSVKQEVPEVFGKMFPASYNEVLWKQIKEIIYFKCGHGTTDDTEVGPGIGCPHCRKRLSTLNQLKEHMRNCHTYSSTKRKSSCPSGKSVIKKMLYRCQYCDEAFISPMMRDNHECSLAAKPLEHLGDVSKSHPNTCGICFQDFGSGSELTIHQKLDHSMSDRPKVSKEVPKQVPKETQQTPKATAQAPPKLTPISKYISCKICEKKISMSLLEEHLRRHQEASLNNVTTPKTPEQPKKCLKCNSSLNSNSQTCDNCLDVDGEDRSICPLCDIELDSTALDQHVRAHCTPVSAIRAIQRTFSVVLCASCGEEFKLQDSESGNKCKNCR